MGLCYLSSQASCSQIWVSYYDGNSHAFLVKVLTVATDAARVNVARDLDAVLQLSILQQYIHAYNQIKYSSYFFWDTL